MTARDIVNNNLICYSHLKGFKDISDFGVDVLVDMMNKYAKKMCDKQKEICAKESKIRTRTFSEDEGHDVSFWWNRAEHYGYYGDFINVYDIDNYSILNAPYPEELIC
jgi:hypothetical protein